MEPTPTDTPDLAPPTLPGQGGSLPQRPAVWPTVVGIVAIVFGAGGVLLYLFGAIATLFLMPYLARLGGPAQAGQMEVAMESAGTQAAISVVQGVIAALLLAAGIGLLRRRPWSVSLTRTWAVLRIVAGVVAAIIGGLIQQSQMAADPTFARGGPAATFATVIPLFTILFTILWVSALPVFMLVWLRLRFVRAEVATWDAPVPGAGG